MATTMTALKYGSSGSSVYTLQQALNVLGYSLATDGTFGSNTLTAVRDFQSRHRLTVDGVVGPQTWGAILLQASVPGAGEDMEPGPGPEMSIAPTITPIPTPDSIPKLPSPKRAVNWKTWGIVAAILTGLWFLMTRNNQNKT